MMLVCGVLKGGTVCDVSVWCVLKGGTVCDVSMWCFERWHNV